MSYQKFGAGYDWRGVALEVGQTVIYGAPVGRSIAMVEAEVIELYMSKGSYPEPKVKLKVRHRAYGGSYRDTVSVGQDRVTVVEKLPPSGLGMTATEEIAERERVSKEREANFATHDLKPEPQYPNRADFPVSQYPLDPLGPTTYGYNRSFYGGVHYNPQAYEAAHATYRLAHEIWNNNPCNRCTAGRRDLYSRACTGA